MTMMSMKKNPLNGLPFVVVVVAAAGGVLCLKL